MYKKRKKLEKREFLKVHVWSEQIFYFHIIISLQKAVKQLYIKHAGKLVNEETEPHLDIGCYLFDVIWGSKGQSGWIYNPCLPATVLRMLLD